MSAAARALAGALVLAATSVAAAAVLAGLPPFGDDWLRWILAIPALAVLGTLVALVHALGHALGGAVAGFRLGRIDAGFLTLERPATHFRLRAGIAPGSARFEAEDRDDLRRRWLVTVLCGPVISFMFGAQCLAFWLATSSMLLAGDASVLVRAVSSALILAGTGSLVYGVLTLIPMRVGAVHTDGWTALRLMKQDADVMKDVAHHIRV